MLIDKWCLADPMVISAPKERTLNSGSGSRPRWSALACGFVPTAPRLTRVVEACLGHTGCFGGHVRMSPLACRPVPNQLANDAWFGAWWPSARRPGTASVGRVSASRGWIAPP